jgi:hypothetical protein
MAVILSQRSGFEARMPLSSLGIPAVRVFPPKPQRRNAEWNFSGPIKQAVLPAAMFTRLSMASAMESVFVASLLSKNKSALKSVADELVQRGTLFKEDVVAILSRKTNLIAKKKGSRANE